MLSLAALLHDPTLRLRLLVLGAEGATEREALWVHNTELPDPSPYVRAGELVLTNGIWRNETTAAEFVASLMRAGAAGLVFGLRNESPTTPEDLVEACTGVGLPLAEIDVAVPFTAVTQAAAALQADQRREALLGLVRRGDALAAAISRGTGASGVLAVLRADHDLPLAVVDRTARNLADEGATLSAKQRRMVAEALTRRPPPLELTLDDDTASLFLVGAIDEADAALLCLRPLADLRRNEREALDQAARFLSLEVAKQQAVQAIEARFAGELLEMVLSGARRATEVPDRLRSFGIDPSAALLVLATALGGNEPAPPGLADAVDDFLLERGLASVVVDGTADVVAVLQHPRETTTRELGESLRTAVRKRFPRRHPVVGVGAPAPSATALRAALVQAREACLVLRRRAGGRVVASFDELGTHRLVLGSLEPETLRTFADPVLGPLREHDRARGGQLEATLRKFLELDGQYGATAAALYVHVNTLRNRLAKVAELTGQDVARTEDRVDLYLALEADAMAQSG